MGIANNKRLQNARYTLTGEICSECDAKIFPPRDVCPNCAKEAKIPFVFSGKGEVYSYTTVYDAPEGYEGNVPYVEAIIKLAEGPMITAQLTDLETRRVTKTVPISQESGWPKEFVEVQVTEFIVQIGMPVEMVTRHLVDEPGPDGDRKKGMRVYGFKFREKIASVGMEREF